MTGVRLWCRQMLSLVRLSLLDLWRRNEVFSLLALALALAVPVSAMKPFGVPGGGGRAAQETALLLIWAFSLFVAIGTGARLFPPEFESRTALPLFAKPVSRGRILLGKFLGAWIASLTALALFYALFASARAFFGGGSGLGLDFWQAVSLHAAYLAVVVATALFFSLFLSSGATFAVSAVLLGGMVLFGRELPELGREAGGVGRAFAQALYVLAPHGEFFDMRLRLVHAWGPAASGPYWAALAYAAAYASALLALSSWILGRKRP